MVALAPVLMAVLSPIALAAAGLARQSLFAVCQIMKLEQAHTPERPAWLEQTAMRAMLDMHNNYSAEFAQWRDLFARHAEELAALVKAFPGAEDLSEAEMRQLLVQAPESFRGRKESGIFQPWTNRWAGFWSNGVPQYHVWDSTRFIDGQWIQPVTLSEFEFVAPVHLDESVRRRRADAAINVCSRGHGVTGWVSRYQRGRFEMPHLGYVINDSTLLWICQIKDPTRLFTRENCWFVFLETIAASSAPAEYRIYGQPILITDEIYADAGARDLHRGTYYAVAAKTAAAGMPATTVKN